MPLKFDYLLTFFYFSKQERLEFLYESGLAVGKAGASEGFKALEAPKKDDAPSTSAASASKVFSFSIFLCAYFTILLCMSNSKLWFFFFLASIIICARSFIRRDTPVFQ